MPWTRQREYDKTVKYSWPAKRDPHKLGGLYGSISPLKLIDSHRLDIMAATSSYMEQAYEKIFRWCSFEFRQMAREVQIEVNPTIREGVGRLRQRSELLK